MIMDGIYKKGLEMPSHVPVPTPLCTKHYHDVYNTIKPTTTHCITCEASLKTEPLKFCPNPTKIENYLRKNTGFEGQIREGDRVCYTCYRSHLMILNEKPVSTDQDLQALINVLEQQLPSSPVKSAEEANMRAMQHVTIHVAKELLKGRAMLLPRIHEEFVRHLKQVTSSLPVDTCSNTEMQSTKSRQTSRWILSNLLDVLQHHVNCECKVHRHGTIVYRADLDMASILSTTLALQKPSVGPATVVQPHPECTCNHNDMLDDLNSRVHSLIDRLLREHDSQSYDYDSLNIEESVREIDPVLWEAVCRLTKTKTEKKENSNKEMTHTKRVRKFFLLCMILFNTDDRCSLPMHTLLTDIVDSQGGSALLVKMLNRLGVCVSMDTLHRFIYQKTNTPDPETETLDDPSESFTIVSADNIDFVHPFARVHKGDTNSCWSGTTVQVVQPMPRLAPCIETENVGLMPACTCSVGETTSYEAVDQPREGQNMQATPDPSQALQVLINRKRVQRLASSPPPIKKLRLRSGTEKVAHNEKCEEKTQIFSKTTQKGAATYPNLNLKDFTVNDVENEALSELNNEIFTYMLHKLSLQEEENKTLVSLQDFLSLVHPNRTQKSEVQYLRVMDAVADTKDTMMSMINDLHKRYIDGTNCCYLVIEGDAKLYEILQSLKQEYEQDLKWMLPFPGDWHALKNYQPALMKAYFDGGLSSLAQAAGYPTKQIKNCGQFKRTHQFLMEAWEATYRAMLNCFIDNEYTQHHDLQAKILKTMERTKDLTDKQLRETFNNGIHQLQKDTDTFSLKFKQFIQKMAQTDDTWKFWVHFLFQDALPYVRLFLAIRSGEWHLRTASLKQMAHLFTAFDHSTYQKVISQHLTDILTMPKSILTMFEQGAFVVSISGRDWHSVGLDEAHEMLINKGCKTSLTKPTPEQINRMAKYLPYRSKMLENIRSQLIPKQTDKMNHASSVLSEDPKNIKLEENVKNMIDCYKQACAFEAVKSNRGLINPFTKKRATNEQTRDLLTFRTIGENEFLLRISYRILNQPSTNAPNRKRRLQTFSDKKVHTKRVTQLVKDRQLVMSAMKKKMLHSAKTGTPIECPGEQYIELPLSLCDNEGNQLKGQKSYVTKFLESRYKNAIPKVINNHLQFTPQCTILEGMFLINTVPLGLHTTFEDYSDFLISRYILPRFKQGSEEVHIIFDNPGRLSKTPKYFEQTKRDKISKLSTQHCCDEIFPKSRIPKGNWHENLINCRTCKRNLVIFLGKHVFPSKKSFKIIGKDLVIIYQIFCQDVPGFWNKDLE